jgi:hypothetical protein
MSRVKREELDEILFLSEQDVNVDGKLSVLNYVNSKGVVKATQDQQLS